MINLHKLDYGTKNLVTKLLIWNFLENMSRDQKGSKKGFLWQCVVQCIKLEKISSKNTY